MNRATPLAIALLAFAGTTVSQDTTGQYLQRGSLLRQNNSVSVPSSTQTTFANQTAAQNLSASYRRIAYNLRLNYQRCLDQGQVGQAFNTNSQTISTRPVRDNHTGLAGPQNGQSRFGSYVPRRQH